MTNFRWFDNFFLTNFSPRSFSIFVDQMHDVQNGDLLDNKEDAMGARCKLDDVDLESEL